MRTGSDVFDGAFTAPIKRINLIRLSRVLNISNAYHQKHIEHLLLDRHLTLWANRVLVHNSYIMNGVELKLIAILLPDFTARCFTAMRLAMVNTARGDCECTLFNVVPIIAKSMFVIGRNRARVFAGVRNFTTNVCL